MKLIDDINNNEIKPNPKSYIEMNFVCLFGLGNSRNYRHRNLPSSKLSQFYGLLYLHKRLLPTNTLLSLF